MNRPGWVDLEWRHDLGPWLNKHGLVGEMAEIGVACGGFARQVLEHWKGSVYHMVDLWEPQAVDVYREKTEGIDYGSYYQECLKIAESNSLVRMHKGNSVELSKEFQDGLLDCAYIDANHAFDYVWDDMEAWWPKVKSGGVFAGHDYGNDINWPHYCQVKAAVDKWASEHGLTFTFGRCGSWWIMKP